MLHARSHEASTHSKGFLRQTLRSSGVWDAVLRAVTLTALLLLAGCADSGGAPDEGNANGHTDAGPDDAGGDSDSRNGTPLPPTSQAQSVIAWVDCQVATFLIATSKPMVDEALLPPGYEARSQFNDGALTNIGYHHYSCEGAIENNRTVFGPTQLAYIGIYVDVDEPAPNATGSAFYAFEWFTDNSAVAERIRSHGFTIHDAALDLDDAGDSLITSIAVDDSGWYSFEGRGHMGGAPVHEVDIAQYHESTRTTIINSDLSSNAGGLVPHHGVLSVDGGALAELGSPALEGRAFIGTAAFAAKLVQA